MFTARVSLDNKAIALALERRAAGQIGRRAERLGVQMEKIIAEMIDRELGPSSGRAAKRGMVPMREIDWQHEVDNPGLLPITVTLFSPDINGPTAAKFGALNFGWQAKYTAEPKAGYSRKGGYGGKQWLRRTGVIAKSRASARFL